MTGRFPASTTAWRSSDVWAEDHRHARPCLSGTDADIGLTDRPSPDARRREPPVAARPRRPCTIPFTVPPTRANVDGRRLPAAATKEGPSPCPRTRTGSTATPGAPRATAPPPRTFGPQGPTMGDLSDAYLQDYQVRQFRSHSTARGRTAHLTAFFGRAARAAALTTHQIRQYQLARRAAGAATGTINRETSALHRMATLAVHWGWLDTVPGFPDRLRENPRRQGFFEHPEYLAVRAHLPAPWQDILDLAYYSGWRKQEILGLSLGRDR